MSPWRLFLRLLGRRAPVVHGELKTIGITGPVYIRRDGYGIPYVEADDDHDAWFGLGFCQGQDRAFQLEGLLRVARGTVAELAGRSGLQVDRISRRLGLRRAADEQLRLLAGEDRSRFEAFAAGVTEGARRGTRGVAHEFALLRARPTPYEAADVLAIGKLLGFVLSPNWDIELGRLKLLTREGPEALAALDPAYPEWHPLTSPPGVAAGRALDRLAEDMAIFRERVGVGRASNNWAIAPSRTAINRPLLANDIHLDPVVPSHWYLAHLRTPRWQLAGAAFAGTPVMGAGHNGAVAWGVTAGLVDNSDLFLEEVGPDGRSVRCEDGFVGCETRTENISVRRGSRIEEEVLVTPRGPILTPAVDSESHAISIRATWLDARPITGLVRAHLAGSGEELRGLMSQWPSASLNVVYADVSGSIGWQLMGDVPKRRKGNGTLPLPGWDAGVGWGDEPVSFHELPHAANPPDGFIATANNQPIGDGSGPFLGVDWVDGYRLMRIVETLGARDDWDVAACAAFQLDVESLAWRELRRGVLEARCETEAATLGLSLLRDWDGQVAADSPAAAVFELLVAELSARVVNAWAPRSAQWALGKGSGPLVEFSPLAARQVGFLVRLFREKPPGWLERSWEAEIGDALDTVVRRLQEGYGDDAAQWAWGRIRPVTLRHSLGARKPLDRVFNLGPFAWGGDANTVSQAATPPLEPTHNPLVLATLRMVVDVGNWEQARFCLPGGQSGNPLSEHYEDQLALWLVGEGVPIHWSQESIDEHAVSMLRLVPGQEAQPAGA